MIQPGYAPLQTNLVKGAISTGPISSRNRPSTPGMEEI